MDDIADRHLVTNGGRVLSAEQNAGAVRPSVSPHRSRRRALLRRLGLVLLVQDFAEALGHHVRPLGAAVVPLKILHWNDIKRRVSTKKIMMDTVCINVYSRLVHLKELMWLVSNFNKHF